MSRATAEPSVAPCSSCPFRKVNHGKRVPKGLYSKANLERLWQGLRRGERLACLEVASPDTNEVKECTGSLSLIARHLELLRSQSFDTYQRRASLPLTQEGITWWTGRLLPDQEQAWSGVSAASAFGNSDAIGVPWTCSVTNGAD